MLVGMATCGIAAGARPVLNAFVEEVAKRNMTEKVAVTQTGCIASASMSPWWRCWFPDRKRSPM